MREIEYEELKNMIKEGKIKEDDKIECFNPNTRYIGPIRYVNITVKEILNILDKDDLKYSLFTIFNESEVE